MLRLFKTNELLVDADDNTGTDGTATLTDSETQTGFDCDRGDQLDVHVDVVAGHAHLNAFGQRDDAGNVGGTEVELRTIVVEERGMTAAFFLLQDVNMAIESGVGMNRAGNRVPRDTPEPNLPLSTNPVNAGMSIVG